MSSVQKVCHHVRSSSADSVILILIHPQRLVQFQDRSNYVISLRRLVQFQDRSDRLCHQSTKTMQFQDRSNYVISLQRWCSFRTDPTDYVISLQRTKWFRNIISCRGLVLSEKLPGLLCHGVSVIGHEVVCPGSIFLCLEAEVPPWVQMTWKGVASQWDGTQGVSFLIQTQKRLSVLIQSLYHIFILRPFSSQHHSLLLLIFEERACTHTHTHTLTKPSADKHTLTHTCTHTHSQQLQI